MIHPEPQWTYSPAPPSPVWPVWQCEAHLLGDVVLGVLNASLWFCLKRDSGAVRWERRMWGRANSIKGLHGGVIVATEHRANDGPWAADFGVYGLALEDLSLRWTAHAQGRWNRVVRALDFVPGFTNELRQTPLAVRHDQVLTDRGRVLDVLTGRDVGAIEITPQLQRELASPTMTLLFGKEAACSDGGLLRAGTPGRPEEVGVMESDCPVRFTKLDALGQPEWVFDASEHSDIRQPEYWRLHFRILEPFVYFVVSEAPAPQPEDAGAPVAQPFSLWSLDMRTGRIVQKASLAIEGAVGCAIQDADIDSLLVSGTGQRCTLALFARKE